MKGFKTWNLFDLVNNLGIQIVTKFYFNYFKTRKVIEKNIFFVIFLMSTIVSDNYDHVQ